MFRHLRIRKGPLPTATVISHAEGKEVIFHNATDIALVMQVTQRLILEKFMCRVSHGISQTTVLTFSQWVGGDRDITIAVMP